MLCIVANAPTGGRYAKCIKNFINTALKNSSNKIGY